MLLRLRYRRNGPIECSRELASWRPARKKHQMFGRNKRLKHSVVDVKTDFPEGLCVETDKGSYYIKKSGKYKFISDRAKETWHLPVVKATFSALEHLPLVTMIGFRDGTVIRDYGTGRTYLISKGKKLHIDSPDTLGRYGMEHIKVLDVSSDEAASHSDGGVFK